MQFTEVHTHPHKNCGYALVYGFEEVIIFWYKVSAVFSYVYFHWLFKCVYYAIGESDQERWEEVRQQYTRVDFQDHPNVTKDAVITVDE